MEREEYLNNPILEFRFWINEKKNEYRDYRISIIMDSQLVVRQVNGIYKIRNENLKVINSTLTN